MEKILIVDDEIDLLEILAFNLEKCGYDVQTATSGEQAMEFLLASKDYSLVLLDVMMSGLSGFQVAEKLKNKGYKVPIIFLTALDTESDLLQGFSLGGDDYIAKPFSVKEVVARVKAVMSRQPKTDTKYCFENINIDIETKTVTVDNQNIILTKTEFALLVTLVKQPSRIFSRDELIHKVWNGAICIEERTVDVHIARLRKKLGNAGSLIINRSGYGYCIESKDK